MEVYHGATTTVHAWVQATSDATADLHLSNSFRKTVRFSRTLGGIVRPEDMMKYWLYLSAAIVAEVVATSALKSSDGFSKLWPSLLVLVGYGTAFFLLSLTLRAIPVGIAYAVWSGVGVVLIALVGWLFFNQKLDALAILGMLLIVSGVVVLNVFSKASVR